MAPLEKHPQHRPMKPVRFPAQSNDPSAIPATPRVESPWAHRPFWEQCERRLAMSAMPWMPWDIGPLEAHHPQLANNLACPSDLSTHQQPIDAALTPAIERHLSEAHSQTGWNQVHSQFGLTGRGQTVAVIDSGIAFDHVALGRGFGPGFRVVGGWDFAENDARPYDDAPAGFHGTHVSGIIGANDGVHFGVAPNVDLVALRVFNDVGKGELAWAESALKWVHENRNSFANPITTVNLSLGSAWNSSSIPAWATLEEELAQLQRDGIVVVASAGNAFQQSKTAGLSYPAASPFVIPVSSIDANGQLSDFSQRDSRSIAAPGRSIESTVPDYFFGKDGISNDWSTASGTSMAAPYIAGASVLVREAMELVGLQNITAQSIYEHLRSTANSVWDSVTQQTYRSLDLDRAIESILPMDTVGDSFATAKLTNVQSSWQTDGWINSLSDKDVYRLSPSLSGNISLQVGSEYVDDAVFTLFRGSQETNLQATHGRLSFSVLAGESIGLGIADPDSIGSYRLNWAFTPNNSGNGGGTAAAIPTSVVDLGTVDTFEQSLNGTSRYKLTAEHSGLLTVVVDAGQQPAGSLQVFRPTVANGTLTDSTLENNKWRIDVQVMEGQGLELVLPGSTIRSVQIVNLIQQQGTTLTVHGTDGADATTIDLRQGLTATVAGVSYQFDLNTIKTIAIEGEQNNDSLKLFGSSLAEKVELQPGLATLENAQINLRATQVENVQFVGEGGPDRAYLYDAPTDDRLNIWPTKAELNGVGYAFSVEQVDRIFVHAIQGGDDQAFLFDSVGNDVLSVRPQFTSISSSGYFNYVAGFERVFAYASAGGIDSAALYDSVGNDLLSTSVEVTSIAGPGFSTFARGFEIVEAFSNAGGRDRALVYAPLGGQLTTGADYVGMQDSSRSSVARSFERVETFLAGQPTPTPAYVSALSPLSTAPNESDVASAAMTFAASSKTGWCDPNRDHASVLERMDWINDLLEQEVRTQRVRLQDPSTASTYEKSGQGLADLDLTWADPDIERSALDAIFAKHT